MRHAQGRLSLGFRLGVWELLCRSQERVASLAGIEEAYGKAKRALETPAGQVLVYDQLLMILGREGKLERWVLWGERL